MPDSSSTLVIHGNLSPCREMSFSSTLITTALNRSGFPQEQGVTSDIDVRITALFTTTTRANIHTLQGDKRTANVHVYFASCYLSTTKDDDIFCTCGRTNSEISAGLDIRVCHKCRVSIIPIYVADDAAFADRETPPGRNSHAIYLFGI